MSILARWWRVANEAVTASASLASWSAYEWLASGLLIGVTAGYLMARWFK